MSIPSATASREVVERLKSARAAERAASLEQVELALVWAHLHPCAEGEQPAYWDQLDLHGEATVLLAGEGAPAVGEFAPAELAAALGLGFEAAQQLISDALELHHRLPRLMEHVRDGVVPVWVARRIAALTTDLCWEAALFADKLVSASPERIGQVHAEKLVHEARLYFDPDRAVADEQEALDRQCVWVRRDRSNPATSEVSMTLDTADAELLDQTVSRIAADLKELGDTDGRDVRRAKAVGVLADPQFALDLMSGREGAAPTTGAVSNFVVHFDVEDFADGTGAADIEKLGTITTDLLAAWLARHDLSATTIRVRPVVDLSGDWSVDRHDPPERMREQVVLTHSTCVFPGCRRDSRGLRAVLRRSRSDRLEGIWTHRGTRATRRGRTIGPDPTREPRKFLIRPLATRLWMQQARSSLLTTLGHVP